MNKDSATIVAAEMSFIEFPNRDVVENDSGLDMKLDMKLWF